MNLLFFLITFLVVAGSAALALYGVVADRPGQALWAGTAAAAWSAGYLVVLLAVSLASHEKVLAWHQFKRFCGLYLDCHAMVSVLNVETARSLGEGEWRDEADGVFYIVTVRQSSDAKRVLIAVHHPEAVVIDEDRTSVPPLGPRRASPGSRRGSAASAWSCRRGGRWLDDQAGLRAARGCSGTTAQHRRGPLGHASLRILPDR